jgi:hypothetical protein
MFWIGLGTGFVVGGVIGIFVVALCMAANHGE